MTDQTYNVLARARQLAVDCGYLRRELTARGKAGITPKVRAGWSSWLGLKDADEKAYEKLQQEMDRKRAALRIAIDQLVSAYCDDLRASPWYIGSLNGRDEAVAATRASVAPQRRLIGRMREIRRLICNAGDDPLHNPWNPLMSNERRVALDWVSACYDLSRLADQSVEAGLPDLRPHLQQGVYQRPENPKDSRLDTWMDRQGQTMRWTLGDNAAAVYLTVPGVLATIDQWLAAADRIVLGEGGAEVEQERQALDDRILAAAHAKLPDDLRQWLFE